MKCKAALCLSVLVFAALVVTACSNAGQKQEEIPNPMVRYDTIESWVFTGDSAGLLWL